MVQQLTARQLQALLTDTPEAPLLLDVREPWEFEICRIEGSWNLPMRQIPNAVNQGTLPMEHRERQVVVICHHGIRSQQVALFLDHHGFSAVLNLQGGVDAWARDVDPAMAKY
jgi:rhodanese-related sulfurtransferase